MLISFLLVLISAVVGEDFCSAPHANGVYCARDSAESNDLLVFCLRGEVARVVECAHGTCLNSRDGVEPALCKINAVSVVNGQLRAQRENSWLVVDERQQGAGSIGQSALEPVVSATEGPCDGHTVTARSQPLGFGDSSDDLIFDRFSVPLKGQVVGVIVSMHVMAQGQGGSANGHDHQQCYLKTLRLKTGNAKSADRAIEGDSFGDAKWSWLRFGHKFDLWDNFDDNNLFTNPDFFVETDVDAYGSDDALAPVVCQVDCVNMTIFYDDEPRLLAGLSAASAGLANPKPVVLVTHGPQGTPWRWLYPEQAPWPAADEPLWRQPDFDDSAWAPPSAPPLGFDTKGHNDDRAHPLTTLLPVDPDSDAHPVTAYFRTRFTLEKPPACYRRLWISRARIDDGALVYLNGQPLWWYNMRVSPPPSFDGLAWDASSDVDVTAVIPDTVLLLPGENVLAVEVHQVSRTSHDMYFDLALSTWDICGADSAPPGEDQDPRDPAALLLNCEPGTHRCRCAAGNTCTQDGVVCTGAGVCVRESKLPPPDVPGASGDGSTCVLGTLNCPCASGFACGSGLDCTAGLCLAASSQQAGPLSHGPGTDESGGSGSSRPLTVFIVIMFLLALALGVGVWYRKRRLAANGFSSWSTAQGKVQMFGDGPVDSSSDSTAPIQLIED